MELKRNTNRMYPRARFPAALAFLVVIMATGGIPTSAQPVQLEAVVEFIAGQNMYLSVGSEDGINEADTLSASRDNAQLGLLRVVGVTASRTVTTFAGAAFPVTRGDSLTITVIGTGQVEEIADTPPSDTLDTPGRRSVLDQGTDGVQLPPVEEGLRLSGRLALSMDLNTADTQGLRSAFERTRIYRIPTVNVRVRVEEIPGNLRVNVNTRYAYRSNESRLGISPLESFRVYQLNLERALPGRPFQAQVGRFFNPAETFSGYWDGLRLAYVPDAGFGGGILGGFQPERANENFSTDFPKYTAFGSYAYRSIEGSQRYNATLSFHQVFPESPFSTHTFLGLSQTLYYGSFRLRNQIQLDQDPADDQWSVTRLQVHGIVPVGSQVTARVRYFLYRPYQLLLTQNIIGYRRDRLSGGLSVKAFSGTFSADVATNTSDIDRRSFTYTGFASLPRLISPRTGLSTFAQYWYQRGGADVVYVAPSVFHYLGRLRTELQYQYQRSNFDVITSSDHALEWSIHFPIVHRVRSSIRLQTRWGDLTQTYRVYTTVWTRI